MKEPPDPRNRFFKFRSPHENRIALPEAGSAGDPTRAGAELRVYNSAGLTPDDVTVLLPASGWKRLGKAGNPRAYLFKGGADAPIERVVVRRSRLIIRGDESFPYTLNEPAQGRIAVRLELGSGVAFCADAAGRRRDRVNRFLGKEEPPPPSCP